MKELFTALSKAQSEITGALKDSSNPFFKSQYADLASVMTAIKEPFAKYGLTVSQPLQFVDGQILIETILAHSSGESIKSIFPVFSKDNSPQAIGSSITYGRRYALASITGVAQIDDDGEQVQKSFRKEEPQKTFTTTEIIGENFIMPIGKNKGKKLKEIDKGQLKSLYEFLKAQGRTEKDSNVMLEIADYIK